MKYFLVLLAPVVILALSMIPLVYAPPEPDPDSALKFSDHVLTGKVISSEVIPNPNEDTPQKKYRDTVVYEIQVHEWHKNPLDNAITVYGKHYPNDVVPEPMWGVVEFEIGSIVYLYLDETEDGLKFREHASYLVKEPAKIMDKKIIPPPLKQMDLGIKLGHVICDKDKNIVWNIHSKPACVYPETENTLIKRGWAKLRLILPASADPVKELEITGQNEFTYRILGNLIVGDEQHPLSYEKKRELAWEHSQKHHPDQKYLEYAIAPHKQYYTVGDTIPLTLLEWGNYSECWNLVVSIVDKNGNTVYEDDSIRYCAEPDGTPGTFHLYDTGKDLAEFVCPKPDYYRVMVSNGDVFENDVLSNFVCTSSGNPKDLCNTFGGNWISQYDECEMISSDQCDDMNGVYDSCASACRNHPDYPDVICTKQCVPVCSR